LWFGPRCEGPGVVRAAGVLLVIERMEAVVRARAAASVVAPGSVPTFPPVRAVMVMGKPSSAVPIGSRGRRAMEPAVATQP